MSDPFIEERQIGTNDLRASAPLMGGFRHICLRDADDGDVIVVNEDDVEALIEYLQSVQVLIKEGA